MNNKIHCGCQINKIGQGYKHSVYCYIPPNVLIYDGKQYLMKWHLASQSIVKRINWSNICSYRGINDITYSHNYGYYFVFSEDWNIYILSVNLELLKRIVIELKYISHALFMDHNKSFLLISTDQMEMFEVEFRKDKKSMLSGNNFHMEIRQYNQIKQVLDWNRYVSMSYDRNNPFNSYILLFNSHSLALYRLEDMNLLLNMKNIIKNDNSIIEAIYSQHYQYLILGHIQGDITIWRVSTSATHTFKEHQRKISSLILDQRKPYILYSASLDSTIKLWNIDTFTALFSFNIHLQLFDQIHFISPQFFTIQHDYNIYFGILTTFLEYLYLHNSKVKSFDKEMNQSSTDQQGDPLERVQVAFNNNIIISINSIEIEDHVPNDPNKNYVNIFFAPPISHSIRSVHSSPFDQQRYYMHFDSGEICEYTIKNGRTLIESVHSFKDITNIQGYPALQQVTLIKFLDIIPQFVDMETKLWETDFTKCRQLYNLTQSDFDSLGKTLEPLHYHKLKTNLKLITLGCKKGTILFISLHKFNIIFCRIGYNKEDIIEIGVIQKDGQRYLLSFSEDHIMKIIKFNSKIECLKTVQMNSEIGLYQYYKEYLILTINSTQLFFYFQDNQMKINGTLEDHPSKIVSLDVERKRGYVLSTSAELLKICNFNNQCLLNITLDLSMDMGCFGNRKGDILISVEGILCILRNILRFIDSSPEEEIIKTETKIEDYFMMPQQQKKNKIKIISSSSQVQNTQMERPKSTKSKEKWNTQVQNTKLDFSLREVSQERTYYEIDRKDKHILLPAIPSQKQEKSKVNEYLNFRMQKGPIKNRREWTMDKIILKNLMK